MDGYNGGLGRRSKDPERYFNGLHSECPVYVLPGEARFIESEGEMLVGQVGSGVFVSVYDVGLHSGAGTHIVIPRKVINSFPHFRSISDEEWKQALLPLEECIGLMKRNGASKNRLRAHLSGGMIFPDDVHDSGTKNYIIIKEALRRMGLTVISEDFGGDAMRRIHFFPKSGRVCKKLLRRDSDFERIGKSESGYAASK